MKSLSPILLFILSVMSGVVSAKTGLHIHPVEATLIPGKPASFLVSNQSQETLCVRVETESWEISSDGCESYQPNNDIVTSPYQLFLKANGHATVQLSWVGKEQKLPKEQSYRISFLHQSIGKQSQGYHPERTTLYVRSFRPRPSLALRAARIEGQFLSFSLENQGNSHISLESPTVLLRFSDDSQEELSEGAFISGHYPAVLHAHSERILFLRLPDTLLGKTVKSAALGFCGQEEAVCTLLEIDLL